MTDFLNFNMQIMITILKYLCLLLIGTLILKTIYEHELLISDYIDITKTILTTTGVTIAIIITFLFSKLFSERNERVERKRLIDIESKKITAFRKICYFLKSAHEFWEPFGNLKNKLDKKYNNLRLRDYDSDKISYEEYSAFLKEVNFGESGGQAYIGLKEIEGNELSGIVFYDSQLRKNYSLDDIGIIHDASNRVWSFFDTYKDRMIPFRSINDLNRNEIEKNIKLIHPKYETESINNEKIQSLFNEIHEAITRKLFMLTQKNNKFLGKRINFLLLDLIIFVFVIVFGVFILSIDYVEVNKIFHIQVLISIFIISVLDLLINVALAIRSELIIDEFYEL